jgi:LysM repeat protein
MPAESEIIEVREGDTLFGLARSHGVSVAELVSMNRLDSGRIEVGQRLLVPALPR